MIFLLLIPLLIAACAFILDRKITWKEFLLQIGLQVLFLLIIGVVFYQFGLHDTEVWNGTVTKKWREEVSCRHSYPCNCHEVCSGSGKDKSCYEHCDTCYEHNYDVDWDLKSTTGKDWSIDTIDSQGLKEPPRWTKVILGEPTSETHSFTNYIKASPNSLFRQQGVDLSKFRDKLPEYPIGIYDYYRLDRFIPVGISIPDQNMWNTELAQINGELGPQKEINIVIVVTKDQTKDYFYALRQHWIGGKKNDTILVINVDDNNIITWVDVMAFTDNQTFVVKLRDDVFKIGKLDRTSILLASKTNAQYFKRKPMEDYAYLRYLLKPSFVQLIVGLVLSISLALGLSYWMDQEDIFG